MPNIRIKLNLRKLLDHHIYRGEKGDYVDLVVWENRDGEDEYGNTHAVKHSIPKEARDAGEKEPYVGNGKLIEQSGGQHQNRAGGYQRPQQGGFRPTGQPGSQRPPHGAPAEEHEEDDIPF